MATVRMSLDEVVGSMSASETPDVARITGTTELDIARFNVEDGFDPTDTMAGLRRVYSPAEIRERAGLTQTEIAARLRVPVKTWRNWEQGRTSLDPAVRSLLDIGADDPARAFGARGTAPRPAATLDSRELVDIVTSTAQSVESLRLEVCRQASAALHPKSWRRQHHFVPVKFGRPVRGSTGAFARGWTRRASPAETDVES